MKRFPLVGCLSFALFFLAGTKMSAAQTLANMDCLNEQLSIQPRITACSQALTQTPGNRQLHLTRAYLYMNLQDFPKALADIQSVPPNSESHLLRGMIYRSEKNAPSALAEFNQGIALLKTDTPLPLQAELYIQRAETLYELKQSEAHRQDLDQVIKIFTELKSRSPRLRRALYMRSQYWKAQKNYHKAIEDLSQLILLGPRNPIFYSERIELWLKIKALDQALEDFNQLHRLSPEDPWFLISRGEVLLFLKKYDLAESDFHAAQVLSSETKPYFRSLAQIQLAWLYAIQKDFPRADAELKKGIAGDPQNRQSVFFAGWIAHLKGERKTAEAHLFSYFSRFQSGDAAIGQSAEWIDFNQATLLGHKSLNPTQAQIWQRHLEKAQANDLPALEALIKLILNLQP